MFSVPEIGDIFGISPGASDNPKSPQYAIIYDLLSEGEIEGLVDGVSSVYLNGTRLVSTSARSNTNPITVASGRFRTGNTTVTANSGNLGGTAGRYIVLHKGANTSNSFSGNVGEVRLRSNLFFTASMGVNPYFISSLAPKIRIAGLGPEGREYVGTIQQVIDSNTAILDIPFSRTATAQTGGIDLVSTVVTATANSITIANAALSNGSAFQILAPLMPTNVTLSDDRWNFKNTAVAFRTGTQEQPPIIFPDVSTASFLTAIDQELRWGNEWGGSAIPSSYSSAVLGVTNPSEIDLLQLTIEFPAGLYTDGGESGNRSPFFAGFQIKFSYVQNGETKTVITHGPSSTQGIPTGRAKAKFWERWLNEKTGFIRHENTTSFVKTLSIPVEQFKPFSSFTVSISRVNPDSSTDYDFNDSTAISSSRLKYIESQILDKFSYPFSAYAAVSIPAEGFNSPPNRSYHVRGIKVSVPSNYTTREENGSNSATYSGTWNGSFVTKYTNNPAWIFYDLATNKRYGLGKHIDSSMVDKYALYRIARYCDELVDDGKGGLEPRFTCNVYIYQAEEAYKLLRDLATTFRGITYWMQGGLVPVQDSPKEPVYTFTQGNIIDGIFNYEYSGRNARYNEVNITWNNPDQFYEQDVLTVTDQTDIIKRGKTIPMEAVAFGCTSQGQAYRVAMWNMLTSQLETEFISFTTGMNASVLMPGDIINVQDQHLKAIQASGRIKSALSSSNITLDRNVTLTSGSQYQLHVIYDGPGCYLQQATATIGATTYTRGDLIPNIANSTAAANLLDNSGNPVAVSFSPEVHVQKQRINNSLPYTGNVITLSSGFLTTPNVESIWALENITLDNNVEPKKYRILGIKEEQGGTYSIVASQYATQKFAELESKVKIQPPKYIGPRPGDEVPSIQALNITYSRAYDGDINTALDSSYYATISWTPALETYVDDSGTSKTREYAYIDSYEVQHDFFDIPSTSEVELTTEIVSGSSTSLRVYGVTTGIYNVKVRAKNIYGQYSSWLSRRIPLIQQSIQAGFNINGIVSGGAVDSGIIFSSNTFTLLDSYYTFTTPSGRIYTVNAATSAQSTQSFANLRSNYEYYLLWDAANTTDPWKAIEYYYDPSISQPYGIGNSYWKEATATSNGLTQLSGTINVAINTNKVIGSGTFFYDTLSIGGLVKLQSSNAANSFYATVGSIVSNTEFYTRETITKSFTSQTIFIPSLPIDYKNDVIAAKIVTGSGNVASLDIQYVTSTINEPQLLVLDTTSSGFRYSTTDTLVGPSSITFNVNRQNLLGTTAWYVFDANNNSLSNSVLESRSNTSAVINSTSFGNIANNNFIKVRANVDTLSSDATIFRIRDGANGASGSNGSSAISLSLTADRQIFTFDSNNAFKPSGQFVTFTTSKQNAANAVDWTTSPNVNLRANSDPNSSVLTSNDTVYLHIGDFGSSIANVTVTGTLNGRGISDRISIYKLRDSREGHTVVLSNENHTITTDFQGQNGNYSGSGTDFRVWEGSTPLVYNATLAVIPSFNVSVVSNSGIAVNTSPTTITTVVTDDTRRYGNANNIIASSANVIFRVDVRDKFGSNTAYTLQQSFSSTRPGANGANGSNGSIGANSISLSLSADRQIFTFDSNNAFKPSGQFIVFTTSKQNAANAVDWTTSPSVNLRANSDPNSSVLTSNDTVYLHIGDFGSSTSNVTVTGTLNGRGISDRITVIKLRDAREGHAVLVTNESHVISAHLNNANANYAGSGTDFRVWEGSTPLVYNATLSVTPSFNVSVVSNSGIAVNTSPTTITTVVTDDTRRYGNANNIVGNTANVVFRVGVRDKYGSYVAYDRQQSFTSTLAVDGKFVTLAANGQIYGAGSGGVSLSGLGQDVFRIVAQGYTATQSGNPPSPAGLSKNGTHVVSPERSYIFARIARANGAILYSNTYDVYGNGAVTSGRNAETLAADLFASTKDHIAVVISYDEPKTNRLTANLANAMYRAGASRAIFGSSEFKSASAYALVGIPGVGEGNGAEFYQGDVDSSANSWIDASFVVANGVLSSVSGKYTPRTLADYSYTGDLNATYGAAWGSTLTGRPTELTDGRVSAGLNSLGFSLAGLNFNGLNYGMSNVASAINAIVYGNRGLLPNQELDIIDADLKPAGIRGVESIADRSGVNFLDANRNSIELFTTGVSNFAYGFPAIPINDAAVYRLTIRHKSNTASPPATGLYLRFNELNTALATGKTHIGLSSGESITDVRTSIVDLVGNGPMPAASYVEASYVYVPTPNTRFASFSMYNWGSGVRYHVDSVQLNPLSSKIYRQTTQPAGGIYVAGDVWVDTDSNPLTVYQYTGSTWAIISNYTTNTNQLTDGANLGNTAIWGSVVSRPGNLSALTGSEVIQNALITILGNGVLSGIGTAGIQVQNNLISVNSGGFLQNTGSSSYPISSNYDSVIRNPSGGTRVTTASTETGRIKIKLPQLNIDNMLKFTVSIYEYLTGYSCTLEIAGYSYNGGWANVTALVQGGSNVEYPVYFGKDSTSLCVWIGGSTGETWSYPQVQVKDFFVGYGVTPLTVSTWATGWNVSFDTTAISSGSGTNQYSASVIDTLPGADWSKNARRPANLTALTGSEAIQNALISILGNGVLSGIGTAGIQVQNSMITVNSAGFLQNTGSSTQVDNSRVGGSNMLWGSQNGLFVAGPGEYGVIVGILKNGSANTFSLSPGETLTLSSTISQDATSAGANQNATLYLFCANVTGSWFNSAAISTVNQTPTRLSGSVTLPTNIDEMHLIGVGLYHQGGTTNLTGNVYAFNTQVERGSVATTYKPGAEPGATVGAAWGSTLTGRPSNLSTLTGSETIQNALITILGNGILSGIGTAGVQVQNNMITVNTAGYLQNTGSSIQVDNSKVTLANIGYAGITYSEKAIITITPNTINASNSHYQPKIGYNDFTYKWSAGGTNYSNGNRASNTVSTSTPYLDATNRPYLKTYVSFNTTEGIAIKEFEFTHLANFGSAISSSRVLNRMVSAWTDVYYAPYIGINERTVRLEGTTSNTAQTTHYFTQVFNFTQPNEYPSNIGLTLRAYPRNTSGTIYYEFREVSGNRLLYNGTSSVYTCNVTTDFLPALGSATHNFEVRIREGSSTGPILASDRFIVVGAYSAFTGFNLSNPTPTVSVSSAGVLSYANTGTDIVVFNNAITLDNYDAALPNGTWRISATTTDGITAGSFSLLNLGNGADTVLRIGDSSNMTKDIAKITYTIEIKSAAGVVTTKYATQIIGKSVANYNPYPDSDFSVDIGTNINATVCPRNYETTANINYMIIPETSRGLSATKYDLTVKHIPTRRQVTTTCEIVGVGPLEPLNTGYDGVYSGGEFNYGSGIPGFSGGGGGGGFK